MPAREPASTVMLHTVIRASIDSASIAGPWYSTTCPCAPRVPICAMSARIRSLPVTPLPSVPVTVTRIVFGLVSGRVWVASTCSTCEVPMPIASAPNAPIVVVCESQHTTVMPGWTSPSSGPMTWAMPRSGSPRR
jgi:hypothetical protein